MRHITVAVCDTEPLAIEGLRSLLGATGNLRVVAAETCLADELAVVCDVAPAILVLDKSFGMQPVLERLRGFTGRQPGPRVIVWGASVSEAEGLRLLHAGAAGVVRKTAGLDTLLECFAAVARGTTWMEDGLIRAAVTPLRTGGSPLTAREIEVANLVERGMTNREIACELGIRTGTVKIHLKHIFEKTGVHGRYGLALSGLKERGILFAPPVM